MLTYKWTKKRGVMESVAQQYSHGIEGGENVVAKREMKPELVSKREKWVCQDEQDGEGIVGR